ncbi:hypothetical protein BFC17_09385 [Alteromonas lipolytica]|uniref:Phosphate ABC transporter substrate-binding protein n=1 Tax=Alteromonas lipolytica TaxID=1856405 RepID=A0A1E8FJN5_9ALTE|nr:hypothetical protein BFC17_09385 [Alteromonas lipolytica]
MLSAKSAGVVASEAAIAIVVAQNSTIESISKRELIDVFMGRFDVLESGQKVQPVDYVNGSALRANFYRALVGKSERQINAYWSRLIFSGRAKPPAQVDSISESVEFILTNNTALSYIPVSNVSEEMKIVLVLE